MCTGIHGLAVSEGLELQFLQPHWPRTPDVNAEMNHTEGNPTRKGGSLTPGCNGHGQTAEAESPKFKT